MLKKNSYLFFALFWTILITYLSLVTIGKIGSSIKIPHKDKMVHFVFYFLFFTLWYKALYKNWNAKKALILLFISILYGVIMEFLQAVISYNRTADVIDAIANSLGAITGFLVFKKYFTNKIT